MTKLLLILAYLLCDLPTLIERVEGLGLSASLVMFLALYGLFASLLFASAFKCHAMRRPGDEAAPYRRKLYQ